MDVPETVLSLFLSINGNGCPEGAEYKSIYFQRTYQHKKAQSVKKEANLPKLILRDKMVRSLLAPWALAFSGLNLEGTHCEDIVASGTQENSAAIFPVIDRT